MILTPAQGNDPPPRGDEATEGDTVVTSGKGCDQTVTKRRPEGSTGGLTDENGWRLASNPSNWQPPKWTLVQYLVPPRHDSILLPKTLGLRNT